MTGEVRVLVRDRRTALDAFVLPTDPWRYVRVFAVTAYAIAFVGWFRSQGIIIDRISVLMAVAVLLVLANLGRPLYRWRQLATDLVLYSLMWFMYEETRGAADRLGMPLQVESVRNIDRVLFAGTDPTVWLQAQFYDPNAVRWYDVVASVWYYSHFVVPVAVIVMLWICNRLEWILFMRRFATVLAIACVSFVLLPTAPPWMAAGGDRTIRLDALPPLTRTAGRGWRHLGFDSFVNAWEHGRDWVNRVAAMPSLHAGFALIIVLYFFPRIPNRWVRSALLVYPVMMALSLVYLAEHYVIDVLAGWAVVVVSLVLWDRLERSARERRVARTRSAIAGPDERWDAKESSPVAVMPGSAHSVLVDVSVLTAALEPSHPANSAARATLDGIFEHSLADGVPLWLRRDHCHLLREQIGVQSAAALTAAFRIIPDDPSVRRRARRMVVSHDDPAIDIDRAVSLCLLDEHRIGALAAVNDPETG